MQGKVCVCCRHRVHIPNNLQRHRHGHLHQVASSSRVCLLNIYAHRGLFDNKKIVENTISAFKRALLDNFNIELDIRVTKDNKIVVFHDNNIKIFINSLFESFYSTGSSTSCSPSNPGLNPTPSSGLVVRKSN